MTIEVILLALASTVRPTSLAATYALLASAAPRRLMTAYVLAGLAFTVLFGLVVVLAIGGINIGAGSSRTKAEAEIVGGVVALVLAWLVRTGRFKVGGPAGDLPRPKGRWDRLLEERLTLRTALLAGPATHIPGIFYLLALNLIVTHERGRGGALLEVALYNVIWFALPLAALVICVVDPGIARNAIGSVNGWARRHAQRLSVAVLAAMGVVLLVGGIAGLAG
jgi:hypothetical protein